MTEHLGRNFAAGIGGLVVAVLLVVSAALGGLGSSSRASTSASATVAAILPAVLAVYIEASATCPDLSWSLLAAIGTIESNNGTSTAPGVAPGTVNAAGAMGPMQFLPATFAEYDEPIPPGGADPPSPYDMVDAVYAAARLLCANGAAEGFGLADAVYAYNHSAVYVADVLALSQAYANEAVAPGTSGTTGTTGGT